MKAVVFVSQDFAEEAVSLVETAGYKVDKIYPLPSKPNRLFYIPQDKVKLLKDYEADAWWCSIYWLLDTSSISIDN